jgi:hypothetical protein
MYIVHSPTRSYLVGSQGACSLNSEQFQIHLNMKDASGQTVLPMVNTNERGVDLALVVARSMK